MTQKKSIRKFETEWVEELETRRQMEDIWENFSKKELMTFSFLMAKKATCENDMTKVREDIEEAKKYLQFLHYKIIDESDKEILTELANERLEELSNENISEQESA